MHRWVYLIMCVLKHWKHSILTSHFLFVLSLSSCSTLFCKISAQNLGKYGWEQTFLFISQPWGYLNTSWGCVCCSVAVHCEASEWSAWSPCTKKGKTCGFKRGTETRVREITQHPSTKGNLCPPTSETRKCTVQRKKCQKGERGTKRYACLTLHNLMEISLYFSGHS